jgi:2-polyprenyl-3-methyl-5-hydroxy-6-metoxy-1,4-benzoquinol methylase/ribosomal protein S18 acetylase RimI-like enzyme
MKEEETKADLEKDRTTKGNDRFARPGQYFDNYAEEWDQMYAPQNAARAHDYVERENRFLKWVDENCAVPIRVLEFGCGAGHCALAMRQRGHDVTALDVSAEMVEASKRRFENEKLKATFVHGQIADLLPKHEGKFDLIYALGVMDYIEDLDSTFTAIAKLLNGSGRFMLSFTNDQTPFRQIEMPLKRGLAKALFAVSGQQKLKDVAEQSSRSHSLAHIDRIMKSSSELQRTGLQYFSYGIRMGKHWLPPIQVVRKSEEIYQSLGAARWGRGFLLSGEKQGKSKLNIAVITEHDIQSVAKLHQEAFSDSMGVSLGDYYVEQLLRWFAQEEGALFHCAKENGEVLGYVFGALLTAQAGMNRDLMTAAGIGMAANPSVFLRSSFRKELARRAKILFGARPANRASTPSKELLEPVFNLVGIGVSSSARGTGIAGKLMADFEKDAAKLGAATMRLSVYKTNQAARSTYEKRGYESFEHPTNPEVLYYSKSLKNGPGLA